MSKLLIHEPPLQVLPSLAVKLGLNEAIFVQQLHYWLITSPHHRDGKAWVYNTYEQWGEQFPFWSTSTIKRIVSSLRDKGIVITTSEYNKMGADSTLWYTIDYEAVSYVECQLDTPVVSTWHSRSVNLERPIPETTTETINIDTEKQPFLYERKPIQPTLLVKENPYEHGGDTETAMPHVPPPARKQRTQRKQKAEAEPIPPRSADPPPSQWDEMKSVVANALYGSIPSSGNGRAWGHINTTARRMLRDGVDVSIVVDFMQWWWREDWRGKKGQSPSPTQLQDGVAAVMVERERSQQAQSPTTMPDNDNGPVEFEE